MSEHWHLMISEIYIFTARKSEKITELLIIDLDNYIFVPGGMTVPGFTRHEALSDAVYHGKTPNSDISQPA